MSNIDQNRPIPKIESPSWRQIYAQEIDECEESFVPLSLTPESFLVRSAYYVAGYKAALAECFARKAVQKALVDISKALPQNLRIIVLDGWRSKQLQTDLFATCENALALQFPEKNKDERAVMSQDFVALPSSDPERPSPHSTGGAIDLCLADKNGQPLFFGSPFDYPLQISHTRYFEEKVERGEVLEDHEHEALENRRILYHAMINAGFVNYDHEWWHFEYGTQRWAAIKGRSHALYGAKQLVFNSFASITGLAEDEVLLSAGG